MCNYESLNLCNYNTFTVKCNNKMTFLHLQNGNFFAAYRMAFHKSFYTAVKPSKYWKYLKRSVSIGISTGELWELKAFSIHWYRETIQMLYIEVNCSTSLRSKLYTIMCTFVTGYIGVTMQLRAIMHPYKCNCVGGFFEIKQLLEFVVSVLSHRWLLWSTHTLVDT